MARKTWYPRREFDRERRKYDSEIVRNPKTKPNKPRKSLEDKSTPALIREVERVISTKTGKTGGRSLADTLFITRHLSELSRRINAGKVDKRHIWETVAAGRKASAGNLAGKIRMSRNEAETQKIVAEMLAILGNDVAKYDDDRFNDVARQNIASTINTLRRTETMGKTTPTQSARLSGIIRSINQKHPALRKALEKSSLKAPPKGQGAKKWDSKSTASLSSSKRKAYRDDDHSMGSRSRGSRGSKASKKAAASVSSMSASKSGKPSRGSGSMNTEKSSMKPESVRSAKLPPGEWSWDVWGTPELNMASPDHSMASFASAKSSRTGSGKSRQSSKGGISKVKSEPKSILKKKSDASSRSLGSRGSAVVKKEYPDPDDRSIPSIGDGSTIFSGSIFDNLSYAPITAESIRSALDARPDEVTSEDIQRALAPETPLPVPDAPLSLQKFDTASVKQEPKPWFKLPGIKKEPNLYGPLPESVASLGSRRQRDIYSQIDKNTVKREPPRRKSKTGDTEDQSPPVMTGNNVIETPDGKALYDALLKMNQSAMEEERTRDASRNRHSSAPQPMRWDPQDNTSTRARRSDQSGYPNPWIHRKNVKKSKGFDKAPKGISRTGRLPGRSRQPPRHRYFDPDYIDEEEEEEEEDYFPYENDYFF